MVAAWTVLVILIDDAYTLSADLADEMYVWFHDQHGDHPDRDEGGGS